MDADAALSPVSVVRSQKRVGPGGGTDPAPAASSGRKPLRVRDGRASNTRPAGGRTPRRPTSAPQAPRPRAYPAAWTRCPAFDDGAAARWGIVENESVPVVLARPRNDARGPRPPTNRRIPLRLAEPTRYGCIAPPHRSGPRCRAERRRAGRLAVHGAETPARRRPGRPYAPRPAACPHRRPEHPARPLGDL